MADLRRMMIQPIIDETREHDRLSVPTGDEYGRGIEDAAKVAVEYAEDQFARALQNMGSDKIKSETAIEHRAASNIATAIRALKGSPR